MELSVHPSGAQFPHQFHPHTESADFVASHPFVPFNVVIISAQSIDIAFFGDGEEEEYTITGKDECFCKEAGLPTLYSMTGEYILCSVISVYCIE